MAAVNTHWKFHLVPYGSVPITGYCSGSMMSYGSVVGSTTNNGSGYFMRCGFGLIMGSGSTV
jgi:hypothetical protein